jgi:hypothetical protein
MTGSVARVPLLLAGLLLILPLVSVMAQSTGMLEPGTNESDTVQANPVQAGDTAAVDVQPASVQPGTAAAPGVAPGVDRVAVDKPTDLLGALLLGTMWKKNGQTMVGSVGPMPARAWRDSGSYYAPQPIEQKPMEQPAPADDRAAAQ